MGNTMKKFTLSFVVIFSTIHLYAQQNVEEVIVDLGAAKGTSQPIIVHSKNKTKPEKTTAA